FAARGVMHLQEQVGPRLDEPRLSWSRLKRHGAGRVSRDNLCSRRGPPHAITGIFAPLLPAAVRNWEGHPHLDRAHISLARFPGPGHGVVYHLTVAWPDFDLLHPFVFGKVGGNYKILIINSAGGRHREVRRLENDIRLADAPAVGDVDGRRSILRIALADAALGPGDQRVDFALGEGALIGEPAMLGRVGEPGRHYSQQHRFANGPGPGQDVLVRQERHWRHLAGPVAGLAALLQNRQDVLMEGEILSSSGGKGGPAWRQAQGENIPEHSASPQSRLRA